MMMTIRRMMARNSLDAAGPVNALNYC